jgi:hypothetical protein
MLVLVLVLMVWSCLFLTSASFDYKQPLTIRIPLLGGELLVVWGGGGAGAGAGAGGFLRARGG